MDIKCERCGSEYEFDDDRVTEAGVTVKCSHCGHLFKVRKKSFVLTEAVAQQKDQTQDEQDEQGDKNNKWMVRRTDGAVLSFNELTTLQKWIVERRVSRDDEISKSGETWKRLGGIEELSSFFQIVDQATVVTAMPGQHNSPSDKQAGQSAEIAASDSQHAMNPPHIPQPSSVYQTEPVLPAMSMSDVSEPDSWGESVAEMEDDVVEKWKRRSRRKWYVILPLFLVLVGLFVFYLLAPQHAAQWLDKVVGSSSEVSQAAKDEYQQGLILFLKDSAPALNAAIETLDAVVKKTKGEYPDAVDLLAEVYTFRAESALDERSRLDAEIKTLQAKLDLGKKPAAGQSEVKKRIASLKSLWAKLDESAKSDFLAAQKSIDLLANRAPGSFLLMRARANFLRLQGQNRTQFEEQLKQAQALHADDAILVFIEAMAKLTDPNSIETAIEKLNLAIKLQHTADFVRAHYYLAKAYISQKRLEDAKMELKRILEHSPDHIAVKSLLDDLQTNQSETKPADVDSQEHVASEQEDKPALPTTYDGWMRKGRRLLDSDRSAFALRAYEQAMKLKPNDVEAMSGKGLCLLDLGRYEEAVLQFKRALKVNPRYGDAIINLAEAYKFNHEPSEAARFYRRYLEVLPDGIEAQVARTNLEKLE